MAVRGNESEKLKCLSLEEAMASAKRSYEADIDAGFQILHIDLSISLTVAVSACDSLERVRTVWALLGICAKFRWILLLRLEQRSSKQVVLGRLMI